MVFTHIDITNDIVVDDGVFARTEVPRLLLRVVCTAFEALQLVIKVEDVVGLLVAKLTVLKDENGVIIFLLIQ